MRVLILDNECKNSPCLHDLLSQVSSAFRSRKGMQGERDDACDAVLVMNDGRDQGATSLHSALELRNSKPGLPIAVLTLLDADEDDDEALVRGLSLPSKGQDRMMRIEQLQGLMQARRDYVRTQVTEEAVTFEYQG